jgi:hypothetical protein
MQLPISPRFGLVMLVSCAALVTSSSRCFAIRPFTLVEDGYPEARGQLELENTLGFSFHTPADHGFSQWSMENELEYGASENFTLRVKGSYFYQHSDENTGMHFDAAGIEGQYFFLNPNTDSIGLSLIGSAEFGERSATLEVVFVAQKDFAKWIVAYNLAAEVEIDNVFDAGSGVNYSGTITNALGVTYQLTPTIRLGGEVSLESAYDEFRTYAGSNVFIGPVINWIPNDRFWVTAGFDWQLTNTDDEPRYLATIVVGYFF